MVLVTDMGLDGVCCCGSSPRGVACTALVLECVDSVTSECGAVVAIATIECVVGALFSFFFLMRIFSDVR